MIEYHNPDAKRGRGRDALRPVAARSNRNECDQYWPAGERFSRFRGVPRMHWAMHCASFGPASIVHALTTRAMRPFAANEQLLGEIGGDCVGVIAAYGH